MLDCDVQVALQLARERNAESLANKVHEAQSQSLRGRGNNNIINIQQQDNILIIIKNKRVEAVVSCVWFKPVSPQKRIKECVPLAPSLLGPIQSLQ
jgi:hypothetical protein